MDCIRYFTQDFPKLLQYVIKQSPYDYMCISDGTKIKITLCPNIKAFTIDPDDFMKVDMFLVDKKIKRNFNGSSKANISTLIQKNYIDALVYLVETYFSCAKISDNLLGNFFIEACEFSCIDIIMTLLSYIKSINLNNKYRSSLCGGLQHAFGYRDVDIVSVLLDNIPTDCFDFFLCAYTAIENDRLQNLILIEQKYPKENILDFLDVIIGEGHVNIVEYMVSKGANLQEFCNKNTKIITLCAQKGHIEMIEYLLDKVIFSSEQLDLFLRASCAYSPEYVDMLINAGANFVAFGEQLYLDAVNSGNVMLAEYLKKNYL